MINIYSRDISEKMFFSDRNIGKKKNKNSKVNYLILWSWAGGILRILQGLVPGAGSIFLSPDHGHGNYTKRKVKLRIERARFQFVLIVFCNR